MPGGSKATGSPDHLASKNACLTSVVPILHGFRALYASMVRSDVASKPAANRSKLEASSGTWLPQATNLVFLLYPGGALSGFTV